LAASSGSPNDTYPYPLERPVVGERGMWEERVVGRGRVRKWEVRVDSVVV